MLHLTPGMSFAEPHVIDHVERDAEKRNSINRILSNSLFHSSESLSNLLRYLAEHSLKSPNENLKEHQIATEVFHREISFDPRVDSIVRVHTSRLRSRLEEYYQSGAGAKDPWQVRLPRGSHSLLFIQPALPAIAATPPSESRVALSRHWPILALLIGAIILAAAAFWVGRLSNSSARTPNAPPDVIAFWRLALRHPEPPLVVFSNAEFIGRPETGIRYLQPGEPEASVYEGYTGVGEVFGVDALHSVLGSLGRKFDLRRAQRLNWDEARTREIIFLGSPSENLPLRELQLERHFAFRVSQGPERRGDLGIVNLRPKAGEQQIYFASAQPITEDYALIVLTEGTTASQRTVLLAGTTTYGTEAAAEFVADPDSLSALWNRIGGHARIRFLSVLLHTNVKRSVPLETQIVAVRVE